MFDAQQWSEIGVIAIGQEQPIARDQIDQALERSLNGGQVLKNIRVIKLQVVDDGDLGKVVDELAPLVEKGRVVFVPFNDKPVAVREPRALAEVIGDAADKKPGW